MARPRKRDDEKYRKPYRSTRVKGRLVKQLEQLAKRNESDFTDEVNIAVRERLERAGLWPPDGKSSD